MHTFTRQAEADPALTPRREETYVSDFGVGRLVLAGGSPIEHDLPSAGRSATPADDGSRSPWAVLLEQYFAGRPVLFDFDLDAYADLMGFTPFERDVYRALAAVPRGSAVSYGELAALAGHRGAHRAAGSAMARNLLPVILPCHRVIRSDGTLGQYGDDPAWKERLLALEGVQLRREERP